MRGSKWILRSVLSALWITTLVLGHHDAAAVPLSVTIDTTALSGTPAQLAIDLVDGDGVINNSATISGFTSDGILGSASITGGVTGTLPGTIVISDSDPGVFNELLQDITLRASIKFTLDLTTKFASVFRPRSFETNALGNE